jgi:hypothetical protein
MLEPALLTLWITSDEGVAMTDPPKSPAKDTPEPSAFERMKEFTRRLVAVPKSEIPTKPKKRKRN